MDYKIVLDARGGGSDTGIVNNGVTEKEYNLLIAKYISKRLNDLNIDNILTRTNDSFITFDDRISIINDAYGNDSDVIVISINLSNTSSGTEIIYALRNNNSLSYLISNALEDNDFNVNKYYQLRDEDDTSKDREYLIRETGNNQTIIISYGNLNNSSDVLNIKNNYEEFGESIVKGLTDYLKIDYIPISDNYYVVQKGDSLYSISKKYNMTVNELKELNNLTSNILSIGQVLKVINDNKIDSTYVVQKGDTLYSISKKYNMTVNELKELNNLTSNILSIGQVLKVSTDNEIDSTYVVQKGDTLYSISKKYNMTVNELKELNNLTSNILSIGQVLKIK